MKNMRPVHKDFIDVESTSTHSTYASFYTTSAKGFTNFHDLEATSTHTTSASSGFQYTGSAGTPHPLQETLGITATLTKIVTKLFDETLSWYEFTFLGVSGELETVPILDTFNIVVTKSFTEYLTLLDMGSANPFFDTPLPIQDTAHFIWYKLFTEYPVISDSQSPSVFIPISQVNTTKVEVTVPLTLVHDTEIQMSSVISSNFSSNIAVPHFSLPPVTTIASSSDNPFEPTVIIEGDLVLSHPSTYTIPTGVSWYVNMNNTAIGNTTLCDLFGSNMSLDYSGGKFNVRSGGVVGSNATYQGNLGRQVSIFGFTGTITDWGGLRTSSTYTWNTEGIFGTPKMNKDFNIITYANSQFLQFLGAAKLYSIPKVDSWTTISAIARAIATACDVTLIWAVPDAPYRDTLGQTAQNGLEALGSLANQMGATLRWNGTNHYSVVYPNFYAGLWTIPDSRLIKTYDWQYHLDMGLGLTGLGTIGIPVNTTFDPSTREIPDTGNGNGISGNVEIMGSQTKRMTAADAPIVIEFPNDASEVKAQLLLKSGTVIPAVTRYATTNPSEWFTYHGTNKLEKRGTATKRFVYVDYTDFPQDLKEVTNGEFTFNIGFVRQDLTPQFEVAKEDANQALRDLMAKINANNRFIKTFSASVSVTFFGSIPLPGMRCSFTYCGENIQGIIESVSLSNGILTLELAEYLKVHFIDAKLNWELGNGGQA